MRRFSETFTSPKSWRRVVIRNTLEPLPFEEPAFGVARSGVPDQATPSRTNSEPLVTSQSLDLRPSGACGFQWVYSLVTSRSGPERRGANSGGRGRP